MPEPLAAAAPFRVAAAPVSDGAWNVRVLTALRTIIPMLVVANLGRIPVFSTGDREAPLLLNDLCMVLVLCIGGVTAIAKRSFRIDRLTTLALLFASIGAFTAFLAIPRYGLTGTQVLISLAYLARWLAYFGFYVVIINVVESGDAARLWHSLEATILVFVAFGLFQAVFIPHFAQVLYPDSRVYIDFDEQGHRLVSTVLEPNIAGAMIMLVLLVQLAQLSGGVRVSHWKPAMLFAGVVATLSRSTVLGLLTGAVVILAVRGISRRFLRAALVFVVVVAAASPKLLQFAASYSKLKIDASALSRVASWIRAFRIFSDHPILGIGFNTYAFVQERYGYVRLGSGTYSVDGGLIFIALMTGVVGLGVFMAMLVLVFKRCRAVWRDPDAPAEWRAMATGIAAGTIGLCVHSFFVNSLLTSFVLEPLFILWALSFLIARPPARPNVRVGNEFLLATYAVPTR